LAITLLNAETQSTPVGVAVNNMIRIIAFQKTLQYVFIVKKITYHPPKNVRLLTRKRKSIALNTPTLFIFLYMVRV